MHVADNLMLAANRLRSRLACLYRYCSQNITSREIVWFCGRDPCGEQRASGDISRIDRLSEGLDSQSRYASVYWRGGRGCTFASTFSFGRGKPLGFSSLCGSFYTAHQRLVLLAAELLRLDIFDLAWAVFKSQPAYCQGSGEG
jgi:hypothetical protein